MIELKPCPFCGGAPEMVTDAPEIWVRCTGCGTNSDTTATKRRAFNHWNRRHVPDGFQLVPIEMTDNMLAAGYLGGVKTLAKNYGKYCRREKDAWKRMLHAAPEPWSS